MNGTRFEEWIEKAEDDYRTAMALDAADVPAVVCFHSQQCIEKYLKAALVAHGQEAPRIHDLIALNETVEKSDTRFSALGEQLQVLTPYSVIIRYPGSRASPEGAQKACEAMRRLRAQIRRILDLEVEV